MCSFLGRSPVPSRDARWRTRLRPRRRCLSAPAMIGGSALIGRTVLPPEERRQCAFAVDGASENGSAIGGNGGRTTSGTYLTTRPSLALVPRMCPRDDRPESSRGAHASSRGTKVRARALQRSLETVVIACPSFVERQRQRQHESPVLDDLFASAFHERRWLGSRSPSRGLELRHVWVATARGP
jgi:hypothetical protein